jgi:GNAT superfamily N-acetyltransferase
VRVGNAGVDVRPVTSRRELKSFIKLPFRLYRGVGQWVPPLVSERRRHLDRRRNPFFEHAEAEYFLAYRDGRPVGRISAHVDRHMNAHQRNAWGLFGFFECEQDEDLAHALLARAERWLADQGRDRMVGPMDFTTNHECGLLVEGHELPPQILENWHHPYYARLLESYGLGKAMDLLKWELYMSERSKVLPAIFGLAERAETEHGITLRHMRRSDFRVELRRFAEVYHSAWKPNWGFVPLTDAELDHHARELKPILDEDWAMVCEKDGETVAAALTIEDWNQVLKRLNGRLVPLGLLKALWHRRRIDSFRVFALGVKPEYQHTGVAARLYAEHWKVAIAKGYERGEMGWILETNTAMNRGMEAMGGQVVKRHRVYEKSIA